MLLLTKILSFEMSTMLSNSILYIAKITVLYFKILEKLEINFLAIPKIKLKWHLKELFLKNKHSDKTNVTH